MQQHRLPIDNRLFAAFGLIVVLLLVSAVVSYLNTQQLHEDSKWVAHTHEVIAALDSLLASAVDAETGQRGFIITGKESYLEPYHSALSVIHARMEELEKLTSDNERQQKRVAAINTSLHGRLAILKDVLDKRNLEGFEAAQADIKGDRGKKQMDLLRMQISEMLEAEHALLFSRSQESRNSYRTAVTSGAISSLLGVLAVGMLFYFVGRSMSDRDRAAEIIHREREQLEITLTSIGDGVIATDPQGRVTMLNPIAVELTGWTQEDAAGQDLTTVFNIVNETTGEVVDNPALRAIEQGTIVGLANHTELISKDGSRCAIADSASPIRGLSGEIHGAVLVFRDVTERRRAETELQESRQFLVESLDALPAHIAVVDKAGTILLVNEAWQQFAKQNQTIDADYGVGTNYLQACESYGHGEGCQDGAIAAQAIRDVLAEKTSYFEMEYPCHSPDASRWFLMRVNRFESGDGPRAIISHENITSRVQAEANVRESEENFRNLADNISQLVWMTDDTGYIFWYNRQWFEYTGATLADMKGWGWQTIHHPDHVDRVTEKFKHALLTGEFWEDTFPLRGQDGQYRWFLSRARPIHNSDGKIVRWFGTNTDISELRDLENALLEADQRKDQFLATLGHELRNPLAGILGGIEILESPTHDAEDQIEAQRIIGRQSRFMQRLIDDLLDVSRIVRGKVTLDKSTFDLTLLIREVIFDCRRELDDKGLTITLSVESEPLPINGDRERLRQVFTNLFHNAGKFTEPGGKIHVVVDKSANSSVIRVVDTGIGMSPTTLNRIFHPFVQADISLERGRGGLGLGLAIVKGLVELHEGRVQATSAGLNQGSSFQVELPLEATLPAQKSPSPNENFDSCVGTLSVLVIDDRRDASYPIIKFLEKEGHRVHTAFDGPSGVQTAHQYQPDIVVCDIGLPGIDGYEVARQLRADAKFGRCLLIAVTGYGQPQDKNAAHDAGFDLHLVKPVDRTLLLQAIHDWSNNQT